MLYCYGQKDPLSRIEGALMNLATFANSDLYVAFGTNARIDNAFVTMKYLQELKGHLYSNFLSNISCNMYVKDLAKSTRMIPRCQRLCVYNTFYQE